MIVNQLKPGNVWAVLHGGSAFFNEVTFTGSVADASGLLYMNARYYNPSTARFLSQDSYTGFACSRVGAANEKWKFYETNSFTTDDLIPGDLIYWTKQEGRPCHVAVYVGDGYMTDATESGGEIAFRPVENDQMYGGNENAKFLGYARYSG